MFFLSKASDVSLSLKAAPRRVLKMFSARITYTDRKCSLMDYLLILCTLVHLSGTNGHVGKVVGTDIKYVMNV